MTWEGLSPPYRTIVADPPWAYGKRGGFSWREGRPSGKAEPFLSYSSMTVPEIAALEVGNLSEPDAHLYLWTTQRYLWDAPTVVRAWGFEPAKVLTWCKAPTGFSLGGAWGNASEFVVYARRGSLAPTERVSRDWFEWPRGAHSVKPPAFLDLVERVSPGPYVELFARQPRFGWDSWGWGYEEVGA